VEQVPLEAHGVKLNFAGRRTWDSTWSCTFFETRTASTRGSFVNWMELMRSWDNNSGSYKSAYAVTAELELYDDLPQVVKRIRLYNVFPTEVGETQMDQTSGIIQYPVTMSYDWTTDVV
jgi:exo-beta-1,3-glucanase (GH17 family)